MHPTSGSQVPIVYRYSVVNPNILNLDSDPEFWLNLDSDSDPGLDPNAGLCYNL